MLIQEIKESFKKLKYKKAIVTKIASKFNRTYSTVNTFWFGKEWSIPEEHQKQILAIINKQLKFDEIQKQRENEHYDNL